MSARHQEVVERDSPGRVENDRELGPHRLHGDADAAPLPLQRVPQQALEGERGEIRPAISAVHRRHTVQLRVQGLKISLSLKIALLWIRDILVRIRIWIHGSVPLTNGFEICHFRPWDFKTPTKTFYPSFSAYYCLKVHL